MSTEMVVLEQIKLANHNSIIWISQISLLGPSINTDPAISQSTAWIQRARRGWTWEPFPPLSCKSTFRSEGQKEGNQRHTTPFLLTWNPVLHSGSLSESANSSHGRESRANIRTEEKYFKDIIYNHYFDFPFMEKQYFFSKWWLVVPLYGKKSSSGLQLKPYVPHNPTTINTTK